MREKTRCKTVDAGVGHVWVPATLAAVAPSVNLQLGRLRYEWSMGARIERFSLLITGLG